ncbi:MAG TPA: BamA/TamA family outer membrane protein [Bacteroidia bacterium]|nr:BamA/TamA family outer membrane protein [Bacteroidia bacterium]
MGRKREQFIRYGFRKSWLAGVLMSIFYLAGIQHVNAMPAQFSLKDTASVKKHDTNRYKQEDAMDMIMKVIKVKSKILSDSESLQPGKLYTSIFPAIGYGLSNGVTFILASNFSFYTSNLSSTNLSVVTLNPLYSLKQQVIVPIISSIWFKDNEINLLGDYRFYKYPSFTYGLGGKRLLAQSDSVDYSYIKISQEILFGLGHNLYGGFGYSLDYHYNIQEFGGDPQYELYNNAATNTTSSGLVFRLKYDTRTNINNPKSAFYANFVYRDNLTFLGSTSNWQEVQIEFRKYITLSDHPSNVLAFWSWNEFTFGGNVPYFDLPSTGWDDYSNSGRGYIQGRFRGTDIVYLEGEYRFDILNNGLLGGVIFLNGESVPDYPTNDFDAIHFGEGIGIRIKMNKYSGTNLCIDYGFGDGGSRGFFFNVGEVF